MTDYDASDYDFAGEAQAYREEAEKTKPEAEIERLNERYKEALWQYAGWLYSRNQGSNMNEGEQTDGH